MALPSFHLKEIPEDGITLDAPLDASWLRHALEGSELAPATGKGDPGHVHVRVEKHGRDVTLNGTLDAALRGQCVRCLREIDVPVHADFALFLEPKPPEPTSRNKHHEIELTSDQLDADYYENDLIELDRWMREQVLLEAPNHPTCAGECEAPAKPIEVPDDHRRTPDPRLAPLKKFLKHRE